MTLAVESDVKQDINKSKLPVNDFTCLLYCYIYRFEQYGNIWGVDKKMKGLFTQTLCQKSLEILGYGTDNMVAGKSKGIY